jgi:hypothetical protein
MDSPYIISTGGAEPCTAEKCEPFYIREWETMIVGTLICIAIIYIMYNRSDSFADFSGASTQRMQTYDSRAHHGHLGSDNDGTMNTEQFLAMPKLPEIHMPQLIKKGKGIVSTGAATSKFMDFERIDAIDVLKAAEPLPTLIPFTSDDDLEKLVR